MTKAQTHAYSQRASEFRFVPTKVVTQAEFVPCGDGIKIRQQQSIQHISVATDP